MTEGFVVKREILTKVRDCFVAGRFSIVVVAAFWSIWVIGCTKKAAVEHLTASITIGMAAERQGFIAYVVTAVPAN